MVSTVGRELDLDRRGEGCWWVRGARDEVDVGAWLGRVYWMRYLMGLGCGNGVLVVC